jgi:flagellar basal-body rod protein FlgB
MYGLARNRQGVNWPAFDLLFALMREGVLNTIVRQQGHTPRCNPMLNRLNNSLDFQAQALVLRSERQRLIASNIANADTPGYVARDMNFAQALKAATGAVPGATPAVTTSGHIAGLPGAREQASLVYATQSQNSIDGNTVDMDRERASFADNSVRYEATLRFINGSVRTMLSAINGQ